MTLVIRNARQLIQQAGSVVRRGHAMGDVRILEGGGVVIHRGVLEWVGSSATLPSLGADVEVLDAADKVVLPGFIDSHTHLVFAGSREDEFEQRLQGLSYQEIAAQGGGINATVRRVRQASREQLKALARPRLDRLLHFGVTTVEVKSGYGL